MLTWGLAALTDNKSGLIIVNDYNLSNVVSMRLNPFTIPAEMVTGLYFNTLQVQVASFLGPDAGAYAYSGGIDSMTSAMFQFDCTWIVDSTNTARVLVTPLNPIYTFLRPLNVPNNSWRLAIRSNLSGTPISWPAVVVGGVAGSSNPLAITLPAPVSSFAGLLVTIDTPGLAIVTVATGAAYVPYTQVYTGTSGGGSILLIAALDATALSAGTAITVTFLHRVGLFNFRLDSLDVSASVTSSTRIAKTLLA